MNGKREYGDYQTPVDFATLVCKFLRDERNINPNIILEPTCGIGGFLKSSLLFDAEKYYGIEINSEYCQICRSEITDSRVEIINADFFNFNLKQLTNDNLLVIGNPPWVNNSTLSTLGSDNLPKKVNFKGLKGMDALTGASNFDICEYIILKLLSEYRNSSTAIAMLCKTSVARNVFKELKRQHINFSYCDMVEFDATKVFGISVSACLLLIQLTTANSSPDNCNIYSFDDTKTIKAMFGYHKGQFYSDLSSDTISFDGKCCFEWRQGIKHDCSKIMELEYKNGEYINGNKEIVQIEPDLVFPLIKSSMFKTPIIETFKKYVVVTQKKAKEDTAHLEKEVPLTWKYLNSNIAFFEKRKSSIYRGAPAFSMFGVGDYSYSKYKVGVSGFYKEPMFSILSSPDGKPVMTDDTSYFICFPSYSTAYVAMLYLNSKKVQNFLKSIAFLDAKRPYTKKVLERISFSKILKEIDFEELVETEKELKLTPYITKQCIKEFTALPEMAQYSLFE